MDIFWNSKFIAEASAYFSVRFSVKLKLPTMIRDISVKIFNRDTQMGDSPDLDLISDLPQSIVESILTLLPIREAVTKDNHFVK